MPEAIPKPSLITTSVFPRVEVLAFDVLFTALY